MRTLAIALTLLLLIPQSAAAYLHFTITVRGTTLTLKWPERQPVRYLVTNRGVPGVSAGEFQAAIGRAFATWEAVPTATISFRSDGFTTAEPFEDDDVSVLGFQNEPELERVLGATGFVVDTRSGEILESDVFFNSVFPWSTSASGTAGRFDLESVALHEIGHFIGLGHSALGETEVRPSGGRRVLASGAVMFPISFGPNNVSDRTLQPDDIAGVSDLYPTGEFRDTTGAIRGIVTKDGQGVRGAHVVAFNVESGELIGGFSLNAAGEFQIAGLKPGPHVIRVEPLDDADVESFFGGGSRVDANFRVAYLDRLFIAPAGGVGQRVTIAVRPK